MVTSTKTLLLAGMLLLSTSFPTASLASISDPAPDSVTVPGLLAPQCLTTSAGVSYRVYGDVNIAPEMGVGYRAGLRETAKSGEPAHMLHAVAGVRLELPQHAYLAAAANVPLYAGAGDLFSLPGENRDTATSRSATPLSWSGSAGIMVGRQIKLSFYCDQLFWGQDPKTTPLSELRFGSTLSFSTR